NGQINELDKGTQALGQVLGLFSISSIPKRLSLDFSDFFSRGLKFDDLNSKVTFNNGIADTKKMVIIGSFGEMRLSGKSDLVKQTHDQTLVFIPDLSSTSLVTGAVIGGPIGAAASIFYDRLLKEFGLDTNKLAGIEYSIKGPWEKPEIKVTQSFKPILN
ncbi:MAG: AsmA-like C-terminal region-containing protein, partial [Gammaproteobacteria bacterium]